MFDIRIMFQNGGLSAVCSLAYDFVTDSQVVVVSVRFYTQTCPFLSHSTKMAAVKMLMLRFKMFKRALHKRMG